MWDIHVPCSICVAGESAPIQRRHCPAAELKSCTLTAAFQNVQRSEIGQFVKARRKALWEMTPELPGHKAKR